METNKMNDMLKEQQKTAELLLQGLDERFSELKYHPQARSIIERHCAGARDLILANSPEDLPPIVEGLDSLRKDIAELSEQLQKDIRAMIDLDKSLNIISQSIKPVELLVSVIKDNWTEAQPAFYTDVEQTDHIN